MKYELFFPENLGGPFFLHYNLIDTGSQEYQLSSLWTTPWPDKISLFLKIE